MSCPVRPLGRLSGHPGGLAAPRPLPHPPHLRSLCAKSPSCLCAWCRPPWTFGWRASSRNAPQYRRDALLRASLVYPPSCVRRNNPPVLMSGVAMLGVRAGRGGSTHAGVGGGGHRRRHDDAWHRKVAPAAPILLISGHATPG